MVLIDDAIEAPATMAIQVSFSRKIDSFLAQNSIFGWRKKTRSRGSASTLAKHMCIVWRA